MAVADKNRFYPALIAPKTSNATIFICYDDSPGICILVGF